MDLYQGDQGDENDHETAEIVEDVKKLPILAFQRGHSLVAQGFSLPSDDERLDLEIRPIFRFRNVD